MAPAVAPKGNSRPEIVPQAASSDDASIAMGAGEEAKMRELVQALAKAQQKALEDSTWVGRDFAEQARAMHYGEQDRASIHGEVALHEARALMAEGVEVAPLPFPVLPPEAKN